MPTVQAEAAGQVAQGLELYARGMDFADALHLASSEPVEAFYTFDLRFSTKAKKLRKAVQMV